MEKWEERGDWRKRGRREESEEGKKGAESGQRKKQESDKREKKEEEEKKEREERMIGRERKNFQGFSKRENSIISVRQCEEWTEKWR